MGSLFVNYESASIINIMKKKLVCVGVGVVLMTMLTGCNLKQEIIQQIYGEVSGANEPVYSECVSEGRFYHDMLSEEEQFIYDEMLSCIMNFKEESLPLTCQDASSIEKCYNAVLDDYGEIYWVDNAGYNQKNDAGPVEFIFTPSYTMTLDEKNEFDAAMRKEYEKYKSDIDKCKNDYEKVKKAYEMLVKRVDYDADAENNQDIRSVFIDKKSVCAGYSKSVQVMLNDQGIQCGLVHGTTTDGVAHSWNIVRIDDEYYYLDATWGDPEFSNAVSETDVCYDYLNITTDDILYSRTIESAYKLPRCTSMKDNYYVKSGLYFEKWDKNNICEIIKKAYKNKKKSVSVRFSNGIFMSQAMDYLIDEDGIYMICDGLEKVAYTTDSDLCVMTLYFGE